MTIPVSTFSEPTPAYQAFFGIDVGKNTLEIAAFGSKTSQSYPNTKPGWTRLLRDHKQHLPYGLTVLETTGWYERGVLDFLVNKGIAVHRASARKVKHFITSFGTLAKTDRLDALALARYAKERADTLPLYSVVDQDQDTLYQLYSRTEELSRMIVAEKNRLQAPEHKAVTGSIKTILRALEKEQDKLWQKIRDHLDSPPSLQEKYKILQTIDGVGEKTALALLAMMPELGALNRKQAASLAGVAPHPKDSGTLRGYRRMRGGRQNMKTVLHMAALGAVRKKQGKLKAFYDRLTAENAKPKLLALAALKRKIITIANAKLKNYYHNQNHS